MSAGGAGSVFVLDNLGALIFFMTEMIITATTAIVGNYFLIHFSPDPSFWVLPLFVRSCFACRQTHAADLPGDSPGAAPRTLGRWGDAGDRGPGVRHRDDVHGRFAHELHHRLHQLLYVDVLPSERD